MRHRRKSNRPKSSWWKRQKKLVIPQGTPPAPAKFQILQAKNEFLSGSAVLMFKDGFWLCIKTSPSLNFLLKKNAVSAKFDLLQRGFDWHWISPAHIHPPDGLDRLPGFVPATPVNQHTDRLQDAIGTRVAPCPPERPADFTVRTERTVATVSPSLETESVPG